MATKTLKSFSSFHRLVPSIVRRLNDDPALAARALANPILAIEELGIALSPQLRLEVERRLRFDQEDSEHLEALSAEIREYAGVDFNPESGKAVEEVLFKRLKVKKPEGLRVPDLHRTGLPQARRPKRQEEERDPLGTLRKAHPIVAPLMEYRRIARTRPGFADREAYERLKTTDRPLSISSIRIDIPVHEEDNHG